MKNFIIAFFVFLVWSFFGLWLYFWLQPSKMELQDTSSVVTNTTKTEVPSENPSATDTDTINAIAVSNDSIRANTDSTLEASPEPTNLRAFTEKGDVLFSFSEPIRIEKNSDRISIPEATKDFKYRLNSYLIEHPETEVHINSKYSPAENIENPNYGTKRGKKIKELLIAVGIAPERIVIKPRIMPIPFNDSGSYNSAFSFVIQPLDRERMESAKNEIPEGTTFYPTFSNSGIHQSKILDDTLDAVKATLEAHPDLRVNVIGHTDNVGNANDNYQRGLELARQVRWYFVAKGKLSRRQVRASSKGESEPIDTNRTERGRNANQRIEIQYIEN